MLVTIVIDQFAAWVADERLPALPPDGGFARLLREGTYLREARYDFATTETAPGHATLYTGAPPRETGIFNNEAFDEPSGKLVPVLRDASTKLLGPSGPIEGAGSSLARLRAETLADRLRASEPASTIVSLSLKDRGALFGGGRRPDLALWFEPSAGSFVSSTAFVSRLPPWASALSKPASLSGGGRGVWQPLDPGWVSAHAAGPDGQAGEGDWFGFGTSFPHRLDASSNPPAVYRSTPFGDEDLFALAAAAIDAYAPRGGPFLLALSLSSNDYVGHVFGPDSWEAWDELARLDRSLGSFLGALDARFGPSGYGLLLTGDHGTTPTPEAAALPGLSGRCARDDRWGRACGGGRVSDDALAREFEAAAARSLGPGRWLRFDAPSIVLSSAARTLPAGRRAALDAALRAAAAGHPEVERLVATGGMGGPCPPYEDESVEALVCRSVPAPGGGAEGVDYYVVFGPGGVFESYTKASGSNHISHHLYDRSVPVFVRAPGRAGAGVRVEGPLPVAVFAHTAADLLGIAPPASARAAAALTR